MAVHSSSTDSPRPPAAARLDGKIAVVTGSSGGIGRALAVTLAASGADVLIHGHKNRSALSELQQRLVGLGGKCTSVLADVADDGGRQSLLDAAWKWQGRVDMWFNNAGADVLTGDAAQWPFARKLERLWQVDVTGTVLLSREAGRRMKQQPDSGDSSAIVNIGWDQAETGMAGDSGEMFAATKGAIMAFTRSLAQSLAPHVRVNCLAPGWIRTAWGQSASDTWQQRAARECLLERWGTPDDVAQAALFLVSSAGKFINGQVLSVNGGFRFGDKNS
jgi:3-oxoacyl-[acyl-carrier protein] reductase